MFKISLVLLLFSALAYAQDCSPPATQQTLMQRADASTVMALVKVLNIVNHQQTSYGTTYSASVELVCQIKNGRGPLLHEFFTINDLGERPDGCPSRDVNREEEYIFFLTEVTDTVYTVDEVNKQSAVIPTSWDNMEALSSYVQPCLTGLCRPNTDNGWKPMNEVARAELAEIVVWAKVVKKHEFGSSQGHYVVEAQSICEMKTPGNMELGTVFNVTNVGALQGLCEDRHVSEGHEFIMFLTRHYAFFPLPGQTIPPHMLENYILGLDEVNSQHALFNVTADVKDVFSDYLGICNNAATGLTYPLATLASFLFVSVFSLVLV